LRDWPKTAEVLDRHGLRLDLIPVEYRAESILDGLSNEPVTGLRFLMPRALAARDILPETLRRRGAHVDVVAAYQTVLPTAAPRRFSKPSHRVRWTASPSRRPPQ